MSSTQKAADKRPKIYVASRASVPARPAMWRQYRDRGGLRIISTWIDEAGPGQTKSKFELWARIHREVSEADALVLYVEPSDMPLKGAFVEAGMALIAGKRVAVVIYSPETQVGGAPYFPEAERMLGSWIWHPQVRLFASVESAAHWIEAR